MTPAARVSRVIPRVNVTDEDIMQKSKIDIQYCKGLSKLCGQVFTNKTIIREHNPVDIWSNVWLLKPHVPMWSGYMDLVKKGVSVYYFYELLFEAERIPFQSYKYIFIEFILKCVELKS